MIKNVVFDMGNVLMDYNPQLALDMFFETYEDKTLILKEFFDGPECIDGERGLLKNADIYDGVSRRVPERLHERLKKCVDGWEITMQPFPKAQEFVRYVKNSGYKVYVLSNACDLFYTYFPRFAPLDYFDGIVVSSDVHTIKPDIGIYEYFLKKYDLVPEECLFVDDRSVNVEGAIKCGMKGWIYENNFEGIIDLLQAE
jgi:putative hydrolase of the HAD superfamily